MGRHEERHQLLQERRGRFRAGENPARQQRWVVYVNRFGDLETDWQDRIQAGHGFLEHH